MLLKLPITDYLTPGTGSNVRESKKVLDSGFQVMDSSLCHWNLDTGFQSLMRFRIPWAVFRIPKPRIPDSTCKFFLDSGCHSKNFPDSLTWGDIYSILKPMKLFLCYFLFVVEHVTHHNRTILWRERIERKKRRNKGKENYASIY